MRISNLVMSWGTFKGQLLQGRQHLDTLKMDAISTHIGEP
jgi:hypothetical protein